MLKDFDEETLQRIGACPPENCGGVPGYFHLLDVLANPKSQEYLMMKNWVSYGFDPKKFDKKSAQKLIDEHFYI